MGSMRGDNQRMGLLPIEDLSENKNAKNIRDLPVPFQLFDNCWFMLYTPVVGRVLTIGAEHVELQTLFVAGILLRSSGVRHGLPVQCFHGFVFYSVVSKLVSLLSRC